MIDVIAIYSDFKALAKLRICAERNLLERISRDR
jgi:hypothetical protein